MYRRAFLTISFLASITAVLLINRGCEERNAIVLDNTDALEQISHINSLNSSVKNISCETLAIGTNTKVLYIKPSRLVAITSSFGRTQAEVATDGDKYWFWIREFDRDSIYHCPLSKISSTRVTFPMRPNLITSVLCVDELIYDSMSVGEDGSIRLWSKEDDLSKCVTVRDGKISEVVYSTENDPILSMKIKSHQKIDGIELPRSMIIFWHEQNFSTNAEIRKVTINSTTLPEIKMPENLKKVSLIDF